MLFVDTDSTVIEICFNKITKKLEINYDNIDQSITNRTILCGKHSRMYQIQIINIHREKEFMILRAAKLIF